MRPGSAQGQILVLTHEGDDVAGGGGLDYQVDVVGHHAVGVDSHAGPAGKGAQYIHGGQGDLRIAKDRLAIPYDYRYRAYGSSLAVLAGIQSNSFAGRKDGFRSGMIALLQLALATRNRTLTDQVSKEEASVSGPSRPIYREWVRVLVGLGVLGRRSRPRPSPSGGRAPALRWLREAWDCGIVWGRPAGRGGGQAPALRWLRGIWPVGMR